MVQFAVADVRKGLEIRISIAEHQLQRMLGDREIEPDAELSDSGRRTRLRDVNRSDLSGAVITRGLHLTEDDLDGFHSPYQVSFKVES